VTQRNSHIIGTALSYITLIFLSVFFLFPVFVGMLNSLKSEPEMYVNILSLPFPPRWENYLYVISDVNILSHFKNNIIVTIVAVTGIIFCSSLAGYKLSRTPGKLSNFIFLMMWASMLIPFHSIMFPVVKVAQTMRIKNLLIGLPLVYIGLGVNFAIFLYHGFVKNVPRDIEEAARIDGCNQLQCFYRVVFPLLLPITMTIVILDVLWTWNDFLLPLVMISRYENYTLVLVASLFFSTYITDWGHILPILTLTSLPMIIFYLFFQKNIVRGIAEGAVKG
jgi:raffinose/stachyose/melibiose transport system permease protein